MCTKFAVDSSSHFRARTHTVTDDATNKTHVMRLQHGAGNYALRSVATGNSK